LIARTVELLGDDALERAVRAAWQRLDQAGLTSLSRRLRPDQEALAGDLAASEDRYRTLFETMPVGIVHYDADGSVIGANKAAGEILGLDLGRAKTWPVVAQGRTVREDGSPLPHGDLPVPQALRTGRVVADMIIGVTDAKTGGLRWVKTTAVPDARDEHGRPSRAYAVFTDLTEQRKTEAALRAQFAETDVQVIEELSRRLAAGLANADAFAREHAIAEALQRSLLPATLPDIPGLDIAVRSLPATVGADVGGDWYDAFWLKGGLVGLMIGDVAGHNIASASIMGQVRSLLHGRPPPGAARDPAGLLHRRAHRGPAPRHHRRARHPGRDTAGLRVRFGRPGLRRGTRGAPGHGAAA
jgi:PAS domain S-box-containing protein